MPNINSIQSLLYLQYGLVLEMEKKDGIEMEAAKEKEAVGAETTEIEAER
jgi:hypothetical protein